MTLFTSVQAGSSVVLVLQNVVLWPRADALLSCRRLEKDDFFEAPCLKKSLRNLVKTLLGVLKMVLKVPIGIMTYFWKGMRYINGWLVLCSVVDAYLGLGHLQFH